MADHYEQVADQLNWLLRDSGKEVITLTREQIRIIYGLTNYPRLEAREHVTSKLMEKYGIRIAFAEEWSHKITCVFKDHVFEPVMLP